jgi:hypothetical protein
LLCAADRRNVFSKRELTRPATTSCFFITDFSAAPVRKVNLSGGFTVKMSYRIGKFFLILFPFNSSITPRHSAKLWSLLELSSLSSEAWMELQDQSFKLAVRNTDLLQPLPITMECSHTHMGLNE